MLLCRYLFVGFIFECEVGNDLLIVEGFFKIIDGEKVLDNVYFILNKGDKVVFIGCNDIVMIILFKIFMGEMELDSGLFKWGVIIF